jgi:hypothetical protein
MIFITISLKREAPGVSTEAISAMLQGTCLEDSMMMNNDAYDNSLRRYIQTECGLPMSMDLDKHPTDQTTARLSVRAD